MCPNPMCSAFDLFTLPAIGNEGVPQALAQAMASGLPVVTTSVGAILELVQDGKTGLIVPPGNAAALADALARLLSDVALARRLAAAGREHVAARFTTTAMFDAMEKVLHQAARRD